MWVCFLPVVVMGNAHSMLLNSQPIYAYAILASMEICANIISLNFHKYQQFQIIYALKW